MKVINSATKATTMNRRATMLGHRYIIYEVVASKSWFDFFEGHEIIG